MDRSDAMATWEILGRAIDEIYNRNASQLSFEELYRYAYNLVLHKHGDLLYEGVASKITQHLTQTLQVLSETPSTVQLLENLAEAWKEHSVTLTMIRDILMYMDRTYVAQHKRRSVYELGLHLFRITVWEHASIHTRVCDLVLLEIAQERAGMGTSQRDLLKSIISMLLEVGRADFAANVFADLETAFLGTTQEFYHAESLQYLSKYSAAEYVRKAEARIAEEKERSAALCLPVSTEGPLLGIVQTEWIERHARTLVDMEGTGFAVLLKDSPDKLEEMKSMYDLFSKIPQSVDYLRDALADRVKESGTQLLNDQAAGASDPAGFVRGVLSLRERYEKIVEHSFRNESKAAKKLREAFEDFLNVDARAASCLAIYVDELLRVGLRGASEDQVNAELQKVITVFRFLSDKDVFESFYKQHLAKRLLGNRSVSEDAERTMVSLLKAECGYQFTTKLEGMFNDMRISRETREKYKTYRQKQQKQDSSSPSLLSNMDIEVDVLTTGYWPSQNVPACTLPAIVQIAIDRFSKFYLETHTGRKLSWQTSAGAAELRASFGSPGSNNLRRYELCVSTYQMCILLLFNEQETWTLRQIRARTHIPDSELRRHLISLCTPKHRILKKSSNGKEKQQRGITSDEDRFTFNDDYTSKLKRVRIQLVKEASLISSSSTASSGAAASSAAAPADHHVIMGGNGSVPLAVEEDRRHLVEAAIVRIMKARKSLNHNDLIAEVTRQLSTRFNPSPQFIKKRIESLIEREYLERSEEEHRVYNYVA
jgi:cullin 3